MIIFVTFKVNSEAVRNVVANSGKLGHTETYLLRNKLHKMSSIMQTNIRTLPFKFFILL